MSCLSWCWLIVDHVLLGEGFDRWRRLSFFVHPVFVVLFQLYVFSQLLIRSLSNPIFCAFRLVRSVIMSVFLFVRCFLLHTSEVDDISSFTTNASQALANPDMFQCNGFLWEMKSVFCIGSYIANKHTCAGVVLDKKLGATSFHDRIDPLKFSFPGVAHRKLAKSIESDFELVYVGQACLSWEALCQQHRKVKVISDAHRGRFHGEVAEKFQQCQILLERFTETENCEGKRFWNYAQTRFCNAQLLQIPDVSGYVEDVGEGMKGETMEGSQVLEAIEKAMSSFWLFLTTDDNKRCWGFLKKLKLSDRQVEDPKDLQLFTALSKEAHKKNTKMKVLVKKSRRCTKKKKTTPPHEEIQVENLICLVDINLVIRVLKMSVVTSAQLRWCHEKLSSIEFEQGIVRTPNADGGLLFPHS
ncbi:hypothetical protein BHM03_00057426 [Ensete ventricosum]|nr:hypothetical protein BHM03_00057426 [Ensete ventricosum]